MSIKHWTSIDGEFVVFNQVLMNLWPLGLRGEGKALVAGQLKKELFYAASLMNIK